MSEDAQYNYILNYLPTINTALGLPPNAYTAANIHMMDPSDPDYSIANAYTNYDTDQIYLNMRNIGLYFDGTKAVEILAHEVRHLYQDTFQTIPYIPEDPNDLASYNANPREIDANQFATAFVNNY